ncbi:group II intron reverse transcriptase/maturase [Clostridium botulinum]|nr:group II intron reverse transcriptase/maturase [Clostridium botulinum]
MLTYTADLRKYKKKLLRNNEYYNIQDIFDKLYEDSKQGKALNNIMQYITSEENILLAYRNIKRNTGSKTAGVDNKTITYFENMETKRIVEIVRYGLSSYKPGMVRRVEIPKQNGAKRPLGIPTMKDRLIQQCIKQVMEPICEAKFHKHSYGFRPNRSTYHAISRAMSLINMTKMHYVVDIDIKGFFDNVNHGKLLKQVWSIGIHDKQLISVISKMLKAEIQGIGIPSKGTPQGGILSPLLSNIVLNELDWWISGQWETFKTQKDYTFTRYGQIDQSSKYRALRKSSNVKEMFIVRYADDFKVFCKDYKSAQKIYHAVRTWLKERLFLDISPEKSKITNLRKKHTEFLGFKLKAKLKKHKYVCLSNMADKTKKNKIIELKKAIKFVQKKPTSNNMLRLNSKILGMHNYYKIATHASNDFNEIYYSLSLALHNRWKVISSANTNKNKTYMKFYGEYNYKTYNVCGVTLFPIAGIKTSPPKNFKQKICNYTKEGRSIIHSKLKCIDKSILRYIMENPIKGQTTEYNDNRISLYVGQNGCCGITGKYLDIGDMETHHIKPRADGGTDEYKNLIMVKYNIHKLIHATEINTIKNYLDKEELDEKALKKLNIFRNKVGNCNI